MKTFDFSDLEKAVLADINQNHEHIPDYYSLWADEFKVDRKLVKEIAWLHFYDVTKGENINQIKNSIRSTLIQRGYKV
jgi:hypothetical protein